jgi:hypothetical protein
MHLYPIHTSIVKAAGSSTDATAKFTVEKCTEQKNHFALLLPPPVLPLLLTGSGSNRSTK